MDNIIIHYNIRISGRVQGVGFRYSAAGEARYRGIRGFVKNLPDGNVYIEAEGSSEQLNSFVEWCRQGPRLGLVDSVTAEPAPVVNHSSFSIR